MKFEVQNQSLVAALTAAARIADGKGTMPIVANVKLVAEDGTLRIEATDLAVGEVINIPAAVEAEGEVLVDAKRVLGYARAMPGGAVVVEVAENCHATMGSGKVKFGLPGLTTRDFPKLAANTAVEWRNVSAHALLAGIETVFHAVSGDETRHHMAGALIAFDGDGGKVVATATDTQRLATTASGKAEGGILVPRRALVELRKLLAGVDKVSVAATDRNLFVRDADLTFSTTLGNAESFPATEVVVKATEGNEVTVKIDRAALVDAIKRGLIANDDDIVKVAVGGGVRVFTDAFSEEIATETSGEVLAAFNGKHLIDALAVMREDRVSLSFGTPADPVRVTDGSTIAIIMAMV